MQKELKKLLKLSIAFVAVLLFFTLARLYFYFGNKAVFLANTDFNLLEAFSHGFIYDLKFIFSVNSLIILMFFLPFRFRNTIFWQFVVKLWFIILNSGLILIYLIDSKYYQFTSEHIKLYNLPDNNLYQQFISSLNKIDFQFNHLWDIVLVGVFVFIVLWSVFPSINKMSFDQGRANLFFRFTISFSAIFILWITVKEAKDKSGDWQVRLFEKMNRPSAGLAINSPYFILRNYYSEQLAYKSYFDEGELNALFSAKKNYVSRIKNKKNVIIINILNEIANWDEFENNVKKLSANYFISDNFGSQIKSISKQMDEILLSFPDFGTIPLIKTTYAFNQFQSLAEILKQNGYYVLMVANGSDKKLYKAYHNFFGFDKLIFNKHNYKLLSKFENEAKNNNKDAFFTFFQIDSGIEEVLAYIGENKLNNNALIVINLPTPENANDIHPGKTLYLMSDTLDGHFVSSKTQNLDILPSVIDYLDLNKKFIAFGKSVFYKTEKRDVFQYTGKDYVIFDDSLLLRYNGQSTKWLVDYKNDPNEFFDLQDSLPVQKVQLENKIRAIIQENSQRLINNKMMPED
ncbi:MAG: hypothetical protein ABFS35_05870 [Bacteroidota bacterium]